MLIRSMLFVLGLASGGLLIVALYMLIGPSPQPVQVVAAKPAAPRPTMIVVAARDIQSGTLINLRDLRFEIVSPGQVTAADFVRPATANPSDQALADHGLFAGIEGAVSRRRFNEGDPILRGLIVKPGDSGFLAAVLRPDMRAVTISVNLVTGAAGLIFPGDRVDVILTHIFHGQVIDPGHGSIAGTIASDVRVIAIDQRVQVNTDLRKDGLIARTATLEVTALQAEQINLAAKMGDLALAIRSVQSNPVADANDRGASDQSPEPVWAEDVLPAMTLAFPRHGMSKRPGGHHTGDTEGDTHLSIYRGDKVDNVALP